jgi:hypothetical protein
MTSLAILSGVTSLEQLRALLPVAYRHKTIADDEFLTEALGKARTFDVNFAEADLNSILANGNNLDGARASASASAKKKLLLSDGLLLLPSAPPPPRDYIWERYFFAGNYVVLGGPGGVSKTMLAMGLSVHIALGTPWAGRKTAAGGVMQFLGEENAAEISRRNGAIARNLSQAERERIEKFIRAFPMAGKDIRLTRLEQQNAVPTGFDEQIIALAKEFATLVAKVSLIVIDHARLALGGDPNAADHVTEMTRLLTNIATQTGAAVMLLAHSPKSTLGKDDETNAVNATDIAGSSAFVDNARCAMMLTTMDDKQARKFGCQETRQQYARLKIVKNNYGPTGDEIWFHRGHDPDYEVAVLEPVTLQTVPKAGTHAVKALDDKVVAIVKQAPAPLTPTALRRSYSGKGGRLAASEQDVEDATRRLVASGRLILRAPTPDEREEHNIHKNAKNVLWPGKVQGEGCGA